ncbi:hypothetical protein GOODEAATRI_021565 [Goodea atripinnis]|uniref:Uncharacterized protein n=1 Tax=Goodea atripinnis TaxID=208336 RepID=A0ABV0Q0J0_9TELE
MFPCFGTIFSGVRTSGSTSRHINGVSFCISNGLGADSSSSRCSSGIPALIFLLLLQLHLSPCVSVDYFADFLFVSPLGVQSSGRWMFRNNLICCLVLLQSLRRSGRSLQIYFSAVFQVKLSSSSSDYLSRTLQLKPKRIMVLDVKMAPSLIFSQTHIREQLSSSSCGRLIRSDSSCSGVGLLMENVQTQPTGLLRFSYERFFMALSENSTTLWRIRSDVSAGGASPLQRDVMRDSRCCDCDREMLEPEPETPSGPLRVLCVFGLQPRCVQLPAEVSVFRLFAVCSIGTGGFLPCFLSLNITCSVMQPSAFWPGNATR